MPHLLVNDRAHDLSDIDPHRSLLQVLREDLRLTGTKEGCGTGDCGACTVVCIARARDDAPIVGTLNSCITPVGAVIDQQVLTCEGLADGDSLHPVQQAMVDEHGSQCGFCTPGFVMSLVGHQLQIRQGADLGAQSHDAVVRSISGNLCRCTGYRPIIAAAHAANTRVAQGYPADAAQAIPAMSAPIPSPTEPPQPLDPTALQTRYARPRTIDELNRAINALADDANWAFIAGSTDLWLAVTQHYQRFAHLIDISQVTELRGIRKSNRSISIGAATTHAELLNFCLNEDIPALIELLHRFGSPQVRTRGTIGGNIANGSPIADWPPILLALDATLQLGHAAGTTRRVAVADFYRGYKDIDLAPQEYVLSIDFDAPADWHQLFSHKISKREDDDISSVLGAFVLVVDDGVLTRCRIAFGGVAATPLRLPAIEAMLTGLDLTPSDQPRHQTRIDEALTQLAQSVEPLSDVRASADYRRAMCVNLLRNALEQAANPL